MTFASRLAAVTVTALMCSDRAGFSAAAAAGAVSTAAGGPLSAAAGGSLSTTAAGAYRSLGGALPAAAAGALSAAATPGGTETFGPEELVSAGHKFFGNVSRGLASIIERAVSQWGLPNGYILGEEGGGAIVAAYATAKARSTQERRSPPDLLAGTVGRLRLGGDGARTMTLIYNLPATGDLRPLRRRRRLGLPRRRCRHDRAHRQHRAACDSLRHRATVHANVGYLKFTPRATWNPF